VSVSRLVAWTFLWLGGWALFLIDPASHSDIGSALLVGAAGVILIRPRRMTPSAPVRAAGALLVGLVLLFLLMVFVLPPSYTWEFPRNPLLVSGLKVFGVAVAVFGIGVNWRQFTGTAGGGVREGKA
jgi:hypothetical protein